MVLLWNLPAFLSSLGEIITYEIEDLQLVDGARVRQDTSHSGRGTVVMDATGVVQGIFGGQSGRYDIVLGYRVGARSRYSVIFSADDTNIKYQAGGSHRHNLWDTIGRDVELVNGTNFDLQVSNHHEGVAELDFITFVPERSPAYRPNGPEQYYRWRYFLRPSILMI